MDNYYFDETGAYTMSYPADPDALPPDNGTFAPPPEAPAGFWPVVNAARDGWELVEDHRGKEGYLDGKPDRIEQVGPLPAGWSDTPPASPDLRNEEEKRRDAYAIEADPLCRQAQYYQAEAEAWELSGNTVRADAARMRARRRLVLYLAKKEEIRTRHREEGNREYYLTKSGTYHVAGCGFTSAAGEWVSLDELATRNPDAKPCLRCTPLQREMA